MHINISKAQVHIITKNVRKKQNAQIQFGTTHRFVHQKQQSPTRATKARKTSQTPPKQTAVAKKMHNERPEHTRKENATGEITPNQEVIPRKTRSKQIV